MTLLRVLVRRHIAQPPVSRPESSRLLSEEDSYSVQPLMEGYELDTMAMTLSGCNEWTVKVEYCPYDEYGTGPHLGIGSDSTVDLNINNPPELAQSVMDMRITLAQLLGPSRAHAWHTVLHERAVQISKTFDMIANYIWSLAGSSDELLSLTDDQKSSVTWAVPILVGNNKSSLSYATTVTESVSFTLTRSRQGVNWRPWKHDSKPIEALLQLWMLNAKEDLRKSATSLTITGWVLGQDYDRMAGILADCWIDRGSNTYRVLSNTSLGSITSGMDILATEEGLTNVADLRQPLCADIGNNPIMEADRSRPRPMAAVSSQPSDHRKVVRCLLKTMTTVEMATQYLLHRFLYEFTRQCISKINTQTTIIPISSLYSFSTRGMLLFENDTILHLVTQIRDSCNLDTEEAYRIAICSLYANDTLPFPPADIVVKAVEARCAKLKAQAEEARSFDDGRGYILDHEEPRDRLFSHACAIYEYEIITLLTKWEQEEAGRRVLNAICNFERWLGGKNNVHVERLKEILITEVEPKIVLGKASDKSGNKDEVCINEIEITTSLPIPSKIYIV